MLEAEFLFNPMDSQSNFVRIIFREGGELISSWINKEEASPCLRRLSYCQKYQYGQQL